MTDTASLEGKNIIVTGAAGGLGRAMTEALAGAGANVVTMFSSGQGVAKDKDPKEAVRWYRKAAEQGFASAQMKLAFVYSMGVSVPADYGKREYWYRRAAELGERVTQTNARTSCWRAGIWLRETRQ
jgi:TPR repeat protein